MIEEVVLVNPSGIEMGTMEKMEAHQKGLLHLAFSIFLFNSNGEMLIHQRAAGKYHSPNLWTNTCCSHPRPGEGFLDATKRRLREEMGMTCEVKEAFSFIYKAELDQGLTEHELDFVYSGVSDDEPVPNPEEVQSYRYVSITELDTWLEKSPEEFTAWFKICYPELKAKLKL